jgi:Ca-activated chloride channel family protein
MLQKTDRRLLLRRLGLFFSLALFLAFPARSTLSQDKKEETQERRRPTKPDLESKIPQEAPPPERGYTIGVNVDLVLMYTSVFDKSGHFVAGLKKDNFKLFEDGVQQTLTSFSQEDVPISLGILLDLSGSMKPKFEQVNKAALAFIRASNPHDQVFLIGFNDEVELLQDYTSDIDEISDALENTIATGGTALYDAIYLGTQKAHTGSRPKKAIVVITDGEDRDSYYKLDELLAKVQESDVQVFAVGFLDEIPDKGFFGRWSKTAPEKARDALLKICEETGGKAFFPTRLTDIHSIITEIATDLRSQYSLAYFSSNSARDGSFRRVKIELNGQGTANINARYRRGYYAPKAAGKQEVTSRLRNSHTTGSGASFPPRPTP